MPEEKISVMAKRKKDLKSLGSLFGNLGFSRIAYSKGRLSVEKIKGQDLQGKPYLEYRVDFLENRIDLVYSPAPNRSRMARLLELMPTFLNILQVGEEFYDIKPSNIYSTVNAVLGEVSKIIDRDAVEFSTQLSELQTRHESLNSKYGDLVRSSEANTRILLECERKCDELEKRNLQLNGMSDDLLKESLYDWIRMHSGTIDVREFSKAHSVSVTRAEEGLNLLIREGYIKRRVD